MRDMYVLDATDRRILEQLDIDARMPVALVAQKLGLARSTVQAHLDKMQASQALRAHSARITPAALGRPVAAMVQARLDQHQISEAVVALANIPEVLECFAPAGDTDLLLRVVAKDPDDLYRVSEEIRLCPGITRISTSLFLRQVIPYRVTGMLREQNR